MLRWGYLFHRSAHNRFRRVRRRPLAPFFVTLSVLVIGYGLFYFWPSSQTYAYAGETCLQKPTLFPAMQRLIAPDAMQLSFEDESSLGGYPVIARQVCASLKQASATGSELSVRVAPLGLPLSGIIGTVALPEPPSTAEKSLPELVPTEEPLVFNLSEPDETFEYVLRVNDVAEAPCTIHATTMQCDMATLKLAQAQQYDMNLVRLFGGKIHDVLLSGRVETVTPIVITGGNVQTGGVLYDAPGELIVTFDKPVAAANGITLTKADGTAIGFRQATRNNQLVITPAQPLPRQVHFVLGIHDVRATDKGHLSAPANIAFRTSGGPVVVGRSIGAYGVSPSAAIRLTFDVAPRQQDIARFVQVEAAGSVLASRIAVSGRVVTIEPGRSFARCEAFTVRVLEGLSNEHGVTGGSAAGFQSRALCAATFSIGTSAQGRGITAHRFGSGPSTVLYVGATHGNERSSKVILDSWLSHLESVAPSIPAHRSIVVIPAVNPDGYAQNSRTNARGVDLNRNFPANNWKADVTLPGGRLVPAGGGTAPLSEPESAALASYTLSVRPRLVLTYHSQASIVTANESGDSMALAIQYGRSAGYRAVAESQLGGTFNYDTTGAYENWLHDKVGIPTLLIELPGNTANYFNRNRAAMWAMGIL